MVSTVQVYSRAISDFSSIQNDLYKSQSLIGADSKASTFSELNGEIVTVQSYKLSISRANTFMGSISEATRKLDTIINSVEEIYGQALKLKESMVIENSANSNVNDLSFLANNVLDNVKAGLNIKDGNTYLFSGSKTSEPAVTIDLKTNSNIDDSGNPSANYFNGDLFTAEIDASVNLRLNYGVNGSHSAFQKLIGAANLAKSAEDSGGTGLVEAGDMLDESMREMETLIAEMANNLKTLEDMSSYHSEVKFTFEQKLAEIITPDIVELSIETAQAEASLQASMIVFSRVSALSLSDYI